MDKLDLPEPTNDPQLNPIEHDCVDRDRALAGRVGRAVGKLENLEETVASLRRSVGRAVGKLEKEREAVNRDRRFVMSELARGLKRIRDLENGMTDLVDLGFLDRRDDRQPDPAETPGRRRDDRSSIPPDAGPVPGAQTLKDPSPEGGPRPAPGGHARMKRHIEPPQAPELRGRLEFHSYPNLTTTIQLEPGSAVILGCGCKHRYDQEEDVFVWTSWPCEAHEDLEGRFERAFDASWKELHG